MLMTECALIAPVSVPSRGYLFLNKLERSAPVPETGFRPLSGLSISQCDYNWYGVRKCQRFRPLSGLSISQCKYRTKAASVGNTLVVSVPSRGYLFLNP